MKLNQNSYNKIADKWAESRDKSFLSELIIAFAANIKPNGNVLDIGCGTGYPITSYLSEQGFRVTGIDIAEKLLQKAIDRNLSHTTLYLCDFFEFNPKDKYDGIIAFDSFFHFPIEKQRLVYAKVSEWMNEGAYLLFTHGSKAGEIEGEMFNAMFYYSSLDKDEVCHLLADTGLEVTWAKEKYIEKDMDRDLVILARKTSVKNP